MDERIAAEVERQVILFNRDWTLPSLAFLINALTETYLSNAGELPAELMTLKTAALTAFNRRCDDADPRTAKALRRLLV